MIQNPATAKWREREHLRMFELQLVIEQRPIHEMMAYRASSRIGGAGALIVAG